MPVRLDRAAVPIRDLATDGQSDARARVHVPRVQALEDLEDLRRETIVEPDAFVAVV